MARVVGRAISAAARRAPRRAVQRRARKHKVIMETVTQEKKKLRSVICFEAQAPGGYTFIPAGNPLLTTSCKERCRKDGLQIYAVSTTPHLGTHNLSQHVHRIGYHFPSTIVAAVCSELGLYLTSTGKAVPFHKLGALQEKPPATTEADQITINTEARDAIRDLFPNIPDNDLNQIIKTAFQKGQRKVGTASELPLARRAQLAVVAHIRHTYTDYDRLLKQKSFHEARSAVEQETLAKLIAWRGDDENGETALEDVFREVIVISDDDDSETEEEEPSDTRDHSVEILSRNARTHEIQTLPIGTVHGTPQDPLREQSEEAPPGFRIVTRVPAQNAINRRGFNRYQAWNRALTRYRAEATTATHKQTSGSALGDTQRPGNGTHPVFKHEMPDPPTRRVVAPPLTENILRALPGPIYVEKPGQRLPAIPPTDPSSGKTHVGAEGSRHPLEPLPMVAQYESSGRSQPPLTTQGSPETRHLDARAHLSASYDYSQGTSYPSKSASSRSERPPVSLIRTGAPVFAGGPQELNHSNNEAQFGSRSDLSHPFHARIGPSREDPIPSIELESPGLADKRRADGRLVHLTNRMSLRSVTPGYSQNEISRHAQVVAPDTPDDQICKRRRLAHDAASAVNLRSESWKSRNIGNSIPEGPHGPYRRDEVVVLEPHSRDRIHLRRDLPPPAEQHLARGQTRQRSILPGSSQVGPSAWSPLDRTQPAVAHGPMSMQSRSALPSSSRIVVTSDRTIGPPADAPYPEVHPAYFGDRSPHLDRIRLLQSDERGPTWSSHPDTGHAVAHPAPSHGKLYAEGYVRHVGYHEVHPVPVEPYYPRPRHQPLPRVEENRVQPAQARVSDTHTLPDLSRPRGPMENHYPRSLQTASASHDSALRPNNIRTSPRQHHSKPSGTSHDRRPVSGLGAPRRLHDPRSFQMIEQNRPIYVQRVQSQPLPQYPVPDGRPIVIVD